MDTSGNLYRIPPEDRELSERDNRTRLIPLTPKQYEELAPLGAKQRKGYMRNKPCICGSGKKFKKCCWHKYDGRNTMERT